MKIKKSTLILICVALAFCAYKAIDHLVTCQAIAKVQAETVRRH